MLVRCVFACHIMPSAIHGCVAAYQIKLLACQEICGDLMDMKAGHVTLESIYKTGKYL